MSEAAEGSSKAAAFMRVAALATQRTLPLHHDPAPLEPEKIQRILWIRLDHIGDVVMSLPALQALHTRFPRAMIDVMVRPGVASILADLPYIHRVTAYDSIRFPEQGHGAGFFRTVALLRRLRQRHYDLAIEMRGDDIGRILAYFSGAPQRLGPERIFYEEPGAANFSYLLTCPVPVFDEPRHAVQNNLATLAPLGVEVAAPRVELPVHERQRQAVTGKLSMLNVNGPFVVVHAHSNDHKRDWRPELFAIVIDEVERRYNLPVLLSGAKRDSDYNKSIMHLVREKGRTLNGSGWFALRELPALFEKARLLVSVDTGPMHIAAAVGTPIVALFQPALAPRHHPWGLPDAVVLPPAGDEVKSITVPQVLSAIERKLG